MTFSVMAPTAIPGASLKMTLLDSTGRACGYSFTGPQDVPAAGPVAFTSPIFVFSDTVGPVGCALPAAVASVQVTLLRLPQPGESLTTTEYHVQSFPLAYSLREYPRPPVGVPLTAPSIASFTWRTIVFACGIPCLPIPGDPVNVACVASAADGAEATISLSITWDGGTATTSSRTFPAGATSSSGGAVFAFGSTATGQPPRATAECRVVNIRGETATSSIRIPN